MTAIVSRERARNTWLTGAAGLLLLGVAFMMMIAAAPAHAHHRPHIPLQSRVTTDLCRQLTSRIDSTTVRTCLTGPAAPSAWAEAYTPSITSESWSASSSARTAFRPAKSAVS